MLFQIFIALWMMMYLTFGGWSAWIAFSGKYDKNASQVAKIVHWHGRFFIIALISSAILGMAMVFATYIIKTVGLEGV